MKSIKNWAEDDQPREKLLLKGPESLSDAELLAILIGTGNTKESAVELCKKIYAKADKSLAKLARFSVSDLMQFRGIGKAKAVTISASMELARRRSLEPALELKKINSSESAFDILNPILRDLNIECFYLLLLNTGNRVIKIIKLSEGGISGTVVDIRRLFKIALENNSTSIILAHNHPSGQLNPSKQDLELTENIKNAGKILNIPILDHLIVANNSYYSFADEGVL